LLVDIEMFASILLGAIPLTILHTLTNGKLPHMVYLIFFIGMALLLMCAFVVFLNKKILGCRFPLDVIPKY